MSDVSEVPTDRRSRSSSSRAHRSRWVPAFARQANATTALPDQASPDCVSAIRASSAKTED